MLHADFFAISGDSVIHSAAVKPIPSLSVGHAVERER